MITVAAYDRHVEQLFELMRRLHAALTKAQVDYRIVGGMAVFFQVSERDPDAARLTRDVDVAIDRGDLQRISSAAEEFGFRYQRSAGVMPRVLPDNRSLTVAARNERFRAATVRERYAEHDPGIDMLVDAKQPKAHSAVHLLFVREKVRPDYLEPVPGFSEPTVTAEGILLAPVSG